MHIVIIGAGIIGACLAVEAAAAAAAAGVAVRITVLEAAGVAAGASGAAAGALHPFTGMRLSHRAEHIAGFARTRSLLASLDASGGSAVSRTTGILRVVVKEKQAALWARRAAALPAGQAVWRDASVLRADSPQISAAVAGGVWIPEGTFVDVPLFIRECLASAGATCISPAEAVAIEEDAAGVCVRLADGRRVDADHVIVAAGRACRRPLVPVDLPWSPHKGELAVFRGIEPPPVPLNHRGYMAKWGDDELLVGVLDSHEPFVPGPRPTIAAELLERLRLVWDADTSEASLVRAWSGVRPALQNREPRMGLVPGCERTWINVGHGGRGLLIGTLSSQFVCAQVFGLEEPVVPDAWRLD